MLCVKCSKFCAAFNSLLKDLSNILLEVNRLDVGVADILANVKYIFES